MKHAAKRSLVFALCLALNQLACDSPQKSKAEPTTPDPLATIRTLLSLHDLLGKQPEERPDETKDREVDRKRLEPLFKDLNKSDSFVSNLYVGFIVGALARNQGRLYVSKRGERAEVTAGDVHVVLRLEQGSWKIVLEESIPAEIKKKALEEKSRFEEALKKS